MKMVMNWLLLQTAYQRFGSYIIILAVFSWAAWQFGFRSEWQQRQHQQLALQQLKVQHAELPEVVPPAPALPLPPINKPLQLTFLQQQPEQLQLGLRGDFFSLQLWLQQLGLSSWQLMKSEWRWQPEFLELYVLLQQGVQQIASPPISPNPFLAPLPPPQPEPEPPPSCQQLAPPDLQLRLILNQRALLTSEAFATPQLWLRPGQALPGSMLTIAAIQDGHVLLANGPNEAVEQPFCAPSVLHVPAPKRPFLKWQKHR